MDREAQVRDRIIREYYEQEGAMPSEDTLGKLIEQEGLFSPATKPIVPLYGALSNPKYISKTLHNLLKDRTDISMLLENLETKIDRVQEATFTEVTELITKTNNFLKTYKSNSFKNIYNEIPILYSVADVSEFYIQTYGEDVFLEEDSGTTPLYIPQYILLDSQNVKSGKEGISLVRGSQQSVQSELSISSYSENNPVSINTLNALNPISAVVSGKEGDNKGISLEVPLLDINVATITIDTDPINVSILIDNKQFLAKSLDGKTTLDIHQTVTEKLTIILYETAKQVQITVRDLIIMETAASPDGIFGEGLYVTVSLPIDKTYGNLLFKPDEFIPPETSIEWEYSANRLHWTPMEKDSNDEYMPLDWNSDDVTVSPISITDLETANGSIISKLFDLPTDSKGIKVKAGKGAILFKNSVRFTSMSENHQHIVYIDDQGNGYTGFDDGHQHDIENWTIVEANNHTHLLTEELYGTTGFSFYIEVLDETGYSLSLYNPKTITDSRLFKHVSIQSENINYAEDSPETIEQELPVGLHRIELEVSDDIDLSRFNFSEKSILEVLEENFLVQLDLTLAIDPQGREALSWIQPYSLTETDIHNLLLLSEKEQMLRFSSNSLDQLYIKKILPSVFSDVILSSKVYGCVNGLSLESYYTQSECEAQGFSWEHIYESIEEQHAAAEVHMYAGDGASNWDLTLYNLPINDVIWNEWPGAGDPVDNAYTPTSEGTISIESAYLPDTTQSKGTTVVHAGDSSEVSFSLPAEPIGGAVTLMRDNIKTDDYTPPSGASAFSELLNNGSQTIEIDARTYVEEDPIASITLTSDNEIPLQAIMTAHTAGDTVGGVLLDPEVQFQVLNSTGSAATSEIFVIGLDTSTGAYSVEVKGVGTPDVHVLIDTGGPPYLASGDTVQLLTGYTWYKYEDQSTQVLNEFPIEETIDITSSALLSSELAYTYDENTKTLSFSNLPGLGAEFIINISYDYSGMQDLIDISNDYYADQIQRYTHQQFMESTSSPILFLNRDHINGTGGTVSVYNTATWDYDAFDGVTAASFTVKEDTTLNMFYIELSDSATFQYTEGDILNLSYPADVSISVNASLITLSNLPDSSYIWKKYTDNGNTLSPTASTELVLEHPIAPDSYDLIEVDASMVLADGTSYEENNITVISAVGNIVTVNLSGFAGQESNQALVNIYVTYRSYEHTDTFNLRLTYSYYEEVPYSFAYTFETIVPATMSDMYSTEKMLSYFYDISYYTTAGDDLFLKALLKGEGDASPIIRRIGFERQ